MARLLQNDPAEWLLGRDDLPLLDQVNSPTGQEQGVVRFLAEALVECLDRRLDLATFHQPLARSANGSIF